MQKCNQAQKDIKESVFSKELEHRAELALWSHCEGYEYDMDDEEGRQRTLVRYPVPSWL